MSPILIVPLLIGWLSGWLVNYLADVLPVTRKFSRPVCHKCQAPYRWSDYLFFSHCKSCGKGRSARTIITQILIPCISVLLWIYPRPRFPYALALVLIIYLAVVFTIDVEYRLILHPVSLAGAVLGLGTGIYIYSLRSTLVAGVITTLIGGAFGFGVMLIFYFVGEWYVRRMVKRKNLSPDEVALGFGDVNLAGILGLLLGWPTIVAGLLFAVFAGGIASLGILIAMLVSKKYKAFTAIPYAPFLILSGVVILFVLYK
ncbi:MAG TPA: prepilin peptidase [Anaerolineales bacterium]|nr:prepilin peptidase [Anaerolineales bacterium]